MPKLVHFAPEQLTRRIHRSGLRGRQCNVSTENEELVVEVIFAMPVLPDFQKTHQWLRELRQRGRTRMVAVYFDIEKSEPVYVGRYGEQKRFGPASEVLHWVHDNPWGAEVLVPRRVKAKSIVSIKTIRQDIGWTGTPESTTSVAYVPTVCLRDPAMSFEDARRSTTNVLIEFVSQMNPIK